MSANSNHRQAFWLALRLPSLPFKLLGLARGGPPTVCAHNHRVTHVNAAARDLGVTPGMDVTTATALSNCQTHARDLAAEAQALQDLATQLYAYTPYIQTRHHPNHPGLLLELSRCLKLFGGAANLVRNIQTRTKALGFSAQYGLAHTAEAAWLLVGDRFRVAEPSPREAYLEQLKPVLLASLEDYPDAVKGLSKSGFVNLGDVFKQLERDGISSIKKRFGAGFANYLCEVLAIDQHLNQQRLFQAPAKMFEPASHFNELLQFDYPVTITEQLHPAMLLLLEQLETYLRTHQQQCQSITWQLLDIYGNSDELPVQCDRPQYRAQLLYELSRIKLEHYPLPFEVDTLALSCSHTEALQNRDQSLNFDGKKLHNPQAISITAAKLKAHLGEQAVFKVSHKQEHVPEQTIECIALGERAQQTLAVSQKHLQRPRWLFPNPKPVQVRSQGLYWQGYLTLLTGPERIQTQWWDTPVARDYFIALRADALRVWVYQDLHSKQWYIHGVFG